MSAAVGHDVVSHLTIGHANRFARRRLFVKRHPESHCAMPPSICPAARTGLITRPTVLHRDKVIDMRFVGQRVVRNFRDINCPGKRAYAVTLIFFRRPSEPFGGGLILAE